MRWLGPISSWFGRAAVKAAEVFDRSLTLVPQWFSQVAWRFASTYPELATKAYGGNAVVYSCLRLLCQSVAEPPLVASTEAGDGELHPLPTTHPLAALLDRPNELMTQFEMLELIELHIGLAGASYWWKQRSNGGQVANLWPLRPDRILPAYQPRLDAPEGERVIRGWWYLPPGGGTPVLIPRSEVLAFGTPDPSGETGGIVETRGWVQVLATEIAADNEASSFVGSLLANYAQPSMLIKTKMPIRDIEIARRLKAQFMSELGGSHKGEPALLDADTEIEKLSFDLKQLEFPDLRAVAESRVSAAAGVPAILVGLKVGLDKATYSNFESAREFFTETTLAARWRRYSDQFTNDLAPEYGPGLVIRFDTSQVKALAGQRQRHAQPIKEGFAEGVVLVDEYRERVLGLPPLPNGQGQVLYVRNTVTVTKPEELIAEQPEPPALPPPQNALPMPAETDEDELPEEDGTEAAARSVRSVRALADDVERRADLTRDKHTDALLPNVLDALEQQRERVISRWNETAKAWPDADSLVPDDDNAGLRSDLVDRVAAIFEDAFADAGLTLNVGISFDLKNQWVRAELEKVGADLLKDLNQTTRQAITDLIGRAARDGLSIPDVAAEIQKLGTFGEARAETISRTVTAEAYNRGSLRSYQESGLVDEVEVLDGRDFDEECRNIHGQRKPLAWANANLIQHPRCRRSFAPVVRA